MLAATRSLCPSAFSRRHDIDVGGKIDHQADRLAKAAATRQLVAGQRVEAPILGKQQDLVRCLGMKNKGRAIALLVFELGIKLLMPLHGADPALFGTDHGDRLTLHEDLGGIKVDLRRLGAIRAAAVGLHESLPSSRGFQM